MGSMPGTDNETDGRIAVRFEKPTDRAALARDWCRLADRSDASFLLSWDWIGCWLAEAGVEPHLLVARRNGEIVGLALLQASRRGRGRPADLYLNQSGDPALDSIAIEFNGFLVERGDADAILRACLEALYTKGSGRPDWRALHLAGVTARLRDGLDGLPSAVYSSVRRGSPLVDLDAIRNQGIDHVATLSRNTRHQIRRSRRLYEHAGTVTLSRAATAAEALDYLDGLKRLHQAAWTARGKPGAFAAGGFERFHRRLIETAFADGVIDLLRIAAGDETIGYLYNFVHHGQVYGYQSGFAYVDDAKYKPGLLSHSLAIDYYLSREISRYHFMAGESRYKYSLSNDETDLYWIVAWPNRKDYLLNRSLDLSWRGIRRLRRILWR